MMHLYLQIATTDTELPTLEDFQRWLALPLQHREDNPEITIRLVDETESQQLNHQFRDKDRPTNILSFPCELPQDLSLPILGDLVICVPLVKQEALTQGKSLTAHWAHLTVHGALHLLGYDHVLQEEALIMEALEIDYLQQLGFPDPYQIAS